MPAAEDLESLAAALLSMVDNPRHGRAFSFMRSLSSSPPRAILVEGGDATERVAAAQYWALSLNCPHSAVIHQQPEIVAGGEPDAAPKKPCGSCSTCLQFIGSMHRDLFFLDGRSGSISIDDVRSIRSTLGEAPRDASHRIVILAEAQHLTEAAANALLKSLEEALPSTRFVLTAPQRERLLPTLVSRSWVLTMAWPDPLVAPVGIGAEAEKSWALVAVKFLTTGKGLFEKTGTRGGVDAHGAESLIITCQRAIAQALSGSLPATIPPGKSAEADLAGYFASLPESRLAMAFSVLAEGQESVASQVNPALVVDWVMTRLYLLKPRGMR